MEPTFNHIGRPHIHLDATDSTNARAAELADDPAYDGTVVTADLQSQGRGQHGRVWQSPPGVNVLLSVLLFPPPELRRPAVLTAWAAVAVGDTIREAIDRDTTIKWPNDVLLDGKKVCGILIESGLRPGAAQPYFVVGIGLNVNQSADDFAGMELPYATSLSIAAYRILDVRDVTRRLIRRLDSSFGALVGGRFGELESRWAGRLVLVGKPVAAELMDATEVRGDLVAVTLDGVRLRLPDGTVRQLRPEEIRNLR
jgi:BirA family biotin operon repressor/biotin-[acetyl-CoA-carboxylase] ligase